MKMVMAADRSAPAGVSTADMAASQAPVTASRAHICHVLSSLSQQRASATVTVCGPRRRTGRQLAADVAAMGEALSTELGVQRGERVCILGLNRYVAQCMTACFVFAFLSLQVSHSSQGPEPLCTPHRECAGVPAKTSYSCRVTLAPRSV